MEDFIPITESQKIFVANGVFRAVTLDMPEVIEDNNLKTSLGSGQFRWNFIIRNLSNSFEKYLPEYKNLCILQKYSSNIFVIYSEYLVVYSA